MTITRPMATVFALILGAGILAACHGEREAEGRSAATAAGSANQRRSACLSAAEVKSVVGFPVQTLVDSAAGNTLICGYQGTDSGAQGTFVSITLEPAAQADQRIDDVRSGAKLLGGAEARPIAVGERGYAYGSSSKSEAVAVAGEHVYYASIESSAQANIGDKSAAAVQLLERMVR